MRTYNRHYHHLSTQQSNAESNIPLLSIVYSFDGLDDQINMLGKL